MGANFRQQNVTIEEMLGFLRKSYFPHSQKGDVAGGLSRLIRTVNDRMNPSLAFPEVDSSIRAEVVQFLARYMTQHLEKHFDKNLPDNKRLAAGGLRAL